MVPSLRLCRRLPPPKKGGARHHQRGATAVEYAVLAAIIVGLIYVAVSNLGGRVASILSGVANRIGAGP